jgi:hypothetical protein
MTAVLFALTTFGDVIVGYVVTGLGLAAMAWRIVTRGKVLGAQVPDEDKPWI